LADFNTISHNFFDNLVVAYFFWGGGTLYICW